MAGLQTHTIISVDSDNSLAEVKLFNKNYVYRIFELNGNVWLFYFDYGVIDPDIYSKYLVDDTLENVQAIFGDYAQQSATFTKYKNGLDDGEGTVDVTIAADDIIFGVDVADDSGDSVLYIDNGGIVRKIKVNTTVSDIEEEFSEASGIGAMIIETDFTIT